MEPTTNETPEVSTTPTKTNDGGNGVRFALVFVALVAIAVGYFVYNSDKGTDGAQNETTNILGGLVPDTSGLENVAFVNGKAISQADYQNGYTGLAQNLALQGVDTSSPEVTTGIKNQVLQGLINVELLSEAAAKAGISATDEQIATEYELVKGGFESEEAMKTQMETIGLTEADLRSDIKTQLTINQYLAQAVNVSDITVTEDEILDMYNGVNVPEGEKPSLDEVRSIIEGQIQQQKQGAIVEAHIQTLREAAEIETLI